MAIQIYTASYCGYCTLAKKLLTKKNISFTETNLTTKPNKRAEMVERSSGRSSVPQIFISNIHVGGYDEIFQLEKSGVTLLVDEMSLQYLEDAEIDYKDDLNGSQFVIRNPNAVTTCGCGSSFSVE